MQGMLYLSICYIIIISPVARVARLQSLVENTPSIMHIYIIKRFKLYINFNIAVHCKEELVLIAFIYTCDVYWLQSVISTSLESEERGLMRNGICQESADSSLDTRTTLVPSWNRQPQLTYLHSNLSNTPDRLPNAYYSHNYISLCEDQLSSLKPSENICGEILIDGHDPASPVSLYSDTASPSQPNKVDFDGGLQFSSGKYLCTCWLPL